MESLSGRTLQNRYFLRELVGSGGMADVYLAWDQLRNAKMAVKVLRRDLSSNTLFFDRFANEAKILRKLEHPNIENFRGKIIKIDSDPLIHLETDGESLGHSPIEFRILTKSIGVVTAYT